MEFLERDEAMRIAYVDLLCLLHDLVIPLGSQPERSRFDSDTVLNELRGQVHAFSSGREIGQIARANVSAAEIFHTWLAGRESEATKSNPRLNAVDTFINALLKQYDLIRVIRSRHRTTVPEPQRA